MYVKSTINFKRAARVFTHVNIDVMVTRLGNSSFDIRVIGMQGARTLVSDHEPNSSLVLCHCRDAGKLADDGEVSWVADVSIVGVDRSSLKPVPLPEDLRAMLSNFLHPQASL
eukprot:scaffold1_cov402-Prasinococcus_capsulatus_cf.AAC.66